MNPLRLRVSPGASKAERIALHTGCWIWTAHVDASGYGRLTYGGSLKYAHRISFEAFAGAIPDGLELDHLCRNRACVNPTHLEPVTAQVNVRRGMSPGARALRRTVCLYGHPYALHGTVRAGRRICRLCRSTYMRIYNELSKDEIAERKAAGTPVVDLAAHFAAESSGLADTG